MKKILFITVFALLAANLAACGSATAPPVELPAPVVGRITISTPDSSGKSTITGTAGAVTGGQIVMAVNERLVGTSALWKITDSLIPSAYAQSSSDLPTTCNEIGHYCVIASEDGSFTLVIDAVIGDIVTLGLIDQLGEWISERITLVVPASDIEYETNCGGLGLEGRMVDIFNFIGKPVELYEGSDSENNKLKITDNSTTYEYELPGCYAHSLMVLPVTTLSGKIIAISKEDNIVWVGELSDNLFTTARTFVLEHIPIFVADIGSMDYVAIALETTSGLTVGKLSLNDGTVSDNINIPTPPSHTIEEVISLSTIGRFTDNGYVGSIVFRAAQGGTVDHFAYFFESEPNNFSSANYDTPYSLSSLISVSVNDVRDAQLFENDTSVRQVQLVVSDYGNGIIRVLPIGFSGGGFLGILTDSAGSTRSDLIVSHNPIYDLTLGAGLSPRHLGFTSTISTVIAYVLVDDSISTRNYGRITDYVFSPSATYSTIADVQDPSFISVDPETTSVLIGDDVLNQVFDAPY